MQTTKNNQRQLTAQQANAECTPSASQSAADAFRDFWQADDIDLEVPPDPPAD